MKNLLEKYRLKITPGRLAILEYLTKHRQPVSADTISKKLHQSYDLATIYRSLEIFAAKKIIFFEVINNVKNYYFAPKPHHHIICRRCQKTKCLPCSHDHLAVAEFSQISHQLLLSGVCHQCLKSV